MLIGTVVVRNNQSGLGRKQVAGQFGRKGKKQPVTMRAVALPFSIGPQILPGRLNLDDPDVSLRIHCNKIGTAA